ncbi:MAG TPA: PqiC family protein [Verrucomicrobiae bacterium]|nr:PqiC family protein [Verrucomicrobiae bacterium]
MNKKPTSLVRLWSFLSVLAATLGCLSLTGCLNFLKPATSSARYYVLTPLPATASATPTNALAVGVGHVKVPEYLLDTSLAVRRGTNEIDYLLLSVWAERLDKGLQKTIAANLGGLLPTDQIRLSSWTSEDVSVEVHVTIEQFDVDAEGRGVLVAWWRVLAAGGGKFLKAGNSRLTRNGPSPDTNPSGAVATLSDLTADLSQQLAAAITASSQRR